jgi:small conductance mechanosensitive channel
VAAGVVIQTRQPIRIGDEIELDTYRGLVRELNSRSVIIETDNGDRVHLPNRLVLESPLTNRSALDGRRTDVEVRAATNRPAGAIRDLILAAIATEQRIRTEPRPRVFLRGWEPERLTLLVRIWHEPTHDDAVESAAVAAIGTALRDEGVPATVVVPPPTAPRTPPAAV